MECENKKNIVDVMEVCRLCLGTEDLISIFDDRIKIQQNIVEVIEITTGVTITSNDKVSQKVCNKCIHITVKMFKFRSSALLNNIQLKALADGKLKVRLSETVLNVLKEFPKIKLPSSISECNILPVVAINENDVSNWFEQFKKNHRAEKNRSKEVEETRNLSENSLTSENKSIAHEFSDLESTQNLSMESSESNSSTSLLLISRESPIPDIHEVDEDQHKLLQETQVPDKSLELLNHSVSPLKRALSIQADSPKSKKIKTNSNSRDENSINSLVTVKYIHKSLSICDICNGILNNAKDLKKHKISHMKCSLCKKVFRTMKETNEHKERDCSIKKIMNNLPSLKLKRCDDIGELSKECPKTSEIQSDKIAPVVANLNSVKEPVNKKEEVVKVDPVMSSYAKPIIDPNEIFVISDDEDEVHQPVVEKDTSVVIPNDDHNSSKNLCDKSEVPDYTYKKTIVASNENALNIVSALECQDKTTELSSSSSITAPPVDITDTNDDVNMADCVSSDDEHQLVIEMDTNDSPEEDNTACDNKTQDSILEATAGTSNETPLKILNVNKHDETAAVSSSSSIITPNIEITGTNIIDVDLADNDTALLKNLLRKSKKNTKEAGVQTVIPCNADIMPTFKNDKLFELKNVRDYLNFYKIPINISYAANYSVRFSSDSSPISKHRTWSKVNTRLSKNVISKPQTPIQNTQTVSSVKVGATTPMTISSAERIPVGRVTNVEERNACTESFIPSLVVQTTQSVPNLGHKNTESTVSPMSNSGPTPMIIPSTEIIPTQLVTLQPEKANVSNESAASTGVIKNTQFESNNQSVSSPLSNSVYRNIGCKQPTLNSNPPILLNYSLPNVSPYIMPNNYLLTQPSSSQRLPTRFATTDNAKKTLAIVAPTSNKYRNHYVTNSACPLGFPNASSPASVNMSRAPSRMQTPTIVEHISNGTTILTPTKIISGPGNKAPSSTLNMFTVPSNIACPPNINTRSIPGCTPSNIRNNIGFPNNMPPLLRLNTPNVSVTNNMPPLLRLNTPNVSVANNMSPLLRLNTPNVSVANNMSPLLRLNTPNISVTNNMPPPTSSFIPHRLPNAIPSNTDKIPGPSTTDTVSQNSNSNSSSSSNFKQTIRVKNMSELR